MSNPPNLLAEYQTYSYHQFLLLCQDTATAEQVTVGAKDLNALRHPDGNPYQLRTSNSGGSYVTLIDGTSDAHLHITKVSWKTLVSSNKKTADGAYADFGINANGIIDIYEPNGANFFGIIASTAVAMKIPQVSITYALKTVFIGHKPDGSYDYIHGVKPFTFTAFDISAVFDSTGAKYRMTIIGQAGSNTKSDQLILSGSSQFIKPGETLKKTMERTEEILNVAVENGVGEYQTSEENNGKTTINVIPPKYEIKVEKDWEADTIVMGDNENIKIVNGVEGVTINLTQGNSSTVPKAIERLLTSSSTIMKSAKVQNAGAPIEERHIYSVNPVTKIVNGGKVHKYHIGKKIVKTVAPGVDVSTQSAHLTFDYLFTGRNTDIIHFDMKIIHGINVINTLITSPSLPATVNELSGIKTDVTVGKSGSQSTGGAGAVPAQLNIGDTFDQPHYSNSNYPIATTNFYNAIGKQAEIDAIGTVLTIHGNPALLDEMTVNPINLEKGLEDSSLGRINGNWINDPTLVRINVRFPSNPNNVNEGTVPFWFNGLYRMLSIEHMFSGGKFTQKITFGALSGSHPSDSGGEVSGGTAAEQATAAGVNVATPEGVGNNDAVGGNINLGSATPEELKELARLTAIQTRHIEEFDCKTNDSLERFTCFGDKETQDAFYELTAKIAARNWVVQPDDVPEVETLSDDELVDLEPFTPELDNNLAIPDIDETPVDQVQGYILDNSRG